MRRTGDKAMVFDPGSDNVFVLMSSDDYESLLDGDSSQRKKTPALPPSNSGDTGVSTPDVPPEETFRDYSPDEETNFETAMPVSAPGEKNKNDGLEPLDFSGAWDKLNSPALESEESLADVPNEEEEEKFYLEPIE